MIANIKGVAIDSYSYSFTVKFRNYDGSSNDLVEVISIPRTPPKSDEQIRGEIEAIVRQRLREYLLLLSTDHIITEWTKLNYQIEEV